MCVCATERQTVRDKDRNRQSMCEIDFSHLESAHVSRIACILQAVLIALEKELEEESEKEHKTKPKMISCAF